MKDWGKIPAVIALLLAGAFAAAAEEAASAPPLPVAGFEIRHGPFDRNRATRPAGPDYEGPLIDTHAHLIVRKTPIEDEEILSLMDRAGIATTLFLPTPNEAIFRTFEAAERQLSGLAGAHPTRIGRLCGSTYLSVWMNESYRDGYDQGDLAARLARLEEDLKGGCLGIGEIGAKHFSKRGNQHVLDYPLNFPPLLAVAKIAANRQVPLDLHMEPITPDGVSHEEAVFGGYALMRQRFPGIRMILAHTAMTNPANARALLEADPNLMMNLKIVVSGKLAWDNLGPITDRERNLYQDWAALMEDHPDRFMIGSDSRFGDSRFSAKRYLYDIRALRRLLGSLKPAAADLIAHGNAERAFGLAAAGR